MPSRKKTASKFRRYVPSSKIESRPSAGKGLGVFATRAIRRGEVIETAPVLIVPTADEDAMMSSFLAHYIFQTDDAWRYVLALGYASLINHDDDANAEFYVSNQSLIIKALRSIPAHAEVTVDYGWTSEEWRQVGVNKK